MPGHHCVGSTNPTDSKGKVALSLRAAGRMYDFGPSRMDLSVLYGVEIMFGGRPVKYY